MRVEATGITKQDFLNFSLAKKILEFKHHDSMAKKLGRSADDLFESINSAVLDNISDLNSDVGYSEAIKLEESCEFVKDEMAKSLRKSINHLREKQKVSKGKADKCLEDFYLIAGKIGKMGNSPVKIANALITPDYSQRSTDKERAEERIKLSSAADSLELGFDEVMGIDSIGVVVFFDANLEKGEKELRQKKELNYQVRQIH